MLASYNGAGVMKQSYEANVASNESLSQSKFLSICLNLHIDASHNTVKLHNHYIPSNSVHYLAMLQYVPLVYAIYLEFLEIQL